MNKDDRMYFDREAQKTEQLKEVHECLVQIKTPLNFSDVRHIYRWLYRKQITVDIQKNEEGGVAILLMDRLTKEEIIEQFDRLRKEREKHLAEEAPKIQKEIMLIQAPLVFEKIVFIFKALMSKQITIEMLSKPVLDEFKKTDHYQRILRRNEEESI
jgi:hypothetical protein